MQLLDLLLVLISSKAALVKLGHLDLVWKSLKAYALKDPLPVIDLFSDILPLI